MVDTNSSPKVQAASAVISSRAPKFWTPELDCELKRRIENRETYDSIGGALGVSRGAIQWRASRRGLRSLIGPYQPDTWTPERIAFLVESVADRLSYSKIGMGLGLTKNQCVGKAWRLELGKRHTPPPRPALRDPFPLPGHCVYPIGHVDDPDFHFCGARVRAFGAPYCEEHDAITMVRVPTKAPAA